MKNKITDTDFKYLQLLSQTYPDINSASAEIINLQAILNLPKGTEHFVSDIHGEYDAFNHVLRNASGVIKNHINDLYGDTISKSEKNSLSTLIYYPEKKLDIIKKNEKNMRLWYKINLYRLIEICRDLSSKYTRSKVRKALPKEFSYIIDELLNENKDKINKKKYYEEIIETIIRLYQADRFIIALCKLIQRFAIDKLHVIGDIYDRGPDSSKIMDMISQYHDFDIQWGNHDIDWMGASLGSYALICNVIRIQAKYANLDTIEEDYGINLIPLATFSLKTYLDDDCKQFIPKTSDVKKLTDKESVDIAKMHKAISIIQFKVEADIIKRHPEYNMDYMLYLDKINRENGTVLVDGKEYNLNDNMFPTVDIKNPYMLTKEENELLEKIRYSFMNSEKLQKHMRTLFTKGSMYTICNSNLLYHGCIPLNQDHSFKDIYFKGTKLSGRKYFDEVERAVREAYSNKSYKHKENSHLDFMWYLWCGADSPLFGKNKITTFERYFINDKNTHKEIKNTYYELRDNPKLCDNILNEFGLDPKISHIINGHVPVIVKRGENPIKAEGKLFVIDGGFSKAYHEKTGIAGYTLIFNSYGLILVSHEAFKSTKQAIEFEKDIHSSTVALHYSKGRILVSDTDIGRRLKSQIKDLENLLKAYYSGDINEKS